MLINQNIYYDKLLAENLTLCYYEEKNICFACEDEVITRN